MGPKFVKGRDYSYGGHLDHLAMQTAVMFFITATPKFLSDDENLGIANFFKKHK